jgi:hypothetical protein
VDGEENELIAQELSKLREDVRMLRETVSGLAQRMAEAEQMNARLEDAALTTARAMQEISSHWDAVYEAMRRDEVVDVYDEGSPDTDRG